MTIAEHILHAVALAGMWDEVQIHIGQGKQIKWAKKRTEPHLLIRHQPMSLDDAVTEYESKGAQRGCHVMVDEDTIAFLAAPGMATKSQPSPPWNDTNTYCIEACGYSPLACVAITGVLRAFRMHRTSAICHWDRLIQYDGPLQRDTVTRLLAWQLEEPRSRPPDMIEEFSSPKLGNLTGTGTKGLDTGFRVYKLVDRDTAPDKMVFHHHITRKALKKYT